MEVVARTMWNIALQVAAVLCFLYLRLDAQGWVITLFVFFVVGPLLVLVPVVTAIATFGRGRLEWPVQAPFLATAVCMVTAAALFQEVTDRASRSSFVPLVEVLSPGTELPIATTKALWSVGEFAVLGYLGAVVWLLVAVVVTGRRVRASSP